MPSSFSRLSSSTSTSSPTLSVLDVVEFAAGDDALGFVADVDEHFIGAEFDDVAFDDIACGKRQRAGLPHGFFHCEHNLTVLNCGNLETALAGTEAPLPNYRRCERQRRLMVRLYVNCFFSA